jgi:glutamine synthetase
MITIAEYIWIDAFGNLRSKAKTVDGAANIPHWSFDGSSTGQALNDKSEVILVPRKTYINPFIEDKDIRGIFVLCDCYDENMKPIELNSRYKANIIFEQVKEQKPWFGLEQEYVLYNIETKRPLGWPKGINSFPAPQGRYYCGVGADNVFGRHIVNDHYKMCLKMGLKISGINAEVMPGQWEFQVGPCEGIDSGDQMYMARYVLQRICEKYHVYVSFDPKPEKGDDWNGSGCHTNYSTEAMRNDGGIKHIYDAIEKLKAKHIEHIEVYGNNRDRLTGRLETSNINTFTYGISDRTASVRIPLVVKQEGKGYFEDRRPASDCDPYVVTSKIAETTLL